MTALQLPTQVSMSKLHMRLSQVRSAAANPAAHAGSSLSRRSLVLAIASVHCHHTNHTRVKREQGAFR